jgi:hypothetical protein
MLKPSPQTNRIANHLGHVADQPDQGNQCQREEPFAEWSAAELRPKSAIRTTGIRSDP